MPNGKTEKTIGVLGKGVVETLAGTATDDNLELLNAFNITGLDYKGQLTSGFGDRGFGFSFGVSINLGDLILPGLVEAEVGAELKAKSTHYSMVLLQRFPLRYFDLPSAAQSQPSEPVWGTSTPVCLLLLDGAAETIQARVNAKIGVGVDASVGELGLKLKAGAEAEASVEGRLLRLTCQQPEYYVAASDEKLYSRIFEFFSASFPGAVKDWLTTVLASEKEDDENLREKLTKEFKKGAEALLKEWAGLTELPVGMEIKSLKNAVQKPEPTLDDLLAALEALDKLLEAKITILEKTAPGAEETELAKTQQKQIPIFKKQLERLKTHRRGASKAGTEIGSLDKSTPRPHLHLAVVTGQAGAGATAEASLSLQVAGVGAEAGASASASVKGSANLVSYRFQSGGAGNNGDLVMTQDTIITYREVDVAAALEAKLGLEIPDSDDHPYKKELEKKGEWHYRTMTYRSAVAYWKVPPNVPPGNTSHAILGEGSGLVLGCSVQLQRLTKLITTLNKEGSAVENTLLDRLSNSLHVPQLMLQGFLKGVDLLIGAKPTQFKTDSLLLEAGFAFPEETRTVGKEVEPQVYSVQANYKPKTGWKLGKLLEDGKVKEFLQSSPPAGGDFLKVNYKQILPLQVIRLRYRLSDRWNEEETIFKLGFSRLIGLQFQVDRVRGAGHEGVIDLATWFVNKEWNEKPAEGYERSIPPVALLHN